VFHGHRGTIRTVAWSHDHRHVLSASHDRSVRIWDAETARCTQELRGHEACVVNGVWTLDRRFVISCDSSGGLRWWAMYSRMCSGPSWSGERWKYCANYTPMLSEHGCERLSHDQPIVFSRP
jgi:WD40 repeat protein